MTRIATIVMLCSIFLFTQAASANAAPTLTTPSTTNVGANMATLVLQSSGTGTGYFTLLSGSNADCGTGTQVKAGQTGTGTAAPYHGSLFLTANVAGNYTVRNLTQSTAHTVCFTADSPTGTNLNDTPLSANLSTALTTSFAYPVWTFVGNAGFSNAFVFYNSLVFSPDGTPYVAFLDYGNNEKATVMKFINGEWSLVGSAGFSTGKAEYISLAFAPDGIPYISYRDSGNLYKATVMKFSSGAWSEVGDNGFPSSGSTSLAFAPDGTPYVGYCDINNGYKATVKKFQNGNWILVGDAGFSAGQIGVGKLAFSSGGTVYFAYPDAGIDNWKATVMKYTEGGAWSVEGSARFSSAVVSSFSFAVAPDGTPYVAYGDDVNSGRATVMKYSDGSWHLVGNAGFSASFVGSMDLSIDSEGIPYVGYSDFGNNSKVTVMKYNDGSWSTVGGSGFSVSDSRSISLAFAPDGTPYIAFSDGSVNFKTTVMKLDNNRLAINPTSLSFGNLPIYSTSSNQSITISNIGTTSLIASNLTVNGIDSGMFSVSPGTCGTLTPTLASGASCTVNVIFAPTGTGARSASLEIASNDSMNPTISVPLTGTGVIQTYSLTLTKTGAGSGSVAFSTGGSCTGICSQSIDSGTVVNLTPTADTGSTFLSWTGCDLVAGNVCTVTMNGAKEVTAGFAITVQVPEQWMQTPGTPESVTALAIDPATPTTIFAGAFNEASMSGGVFKSTDGGGSWNASGLTNRQILSLAIDPITPATIYAGTTNGGVFKSINGGGSWSDMNSGLTSSYVRALAIDPTTSETVYAGTDAGVFKSTNGGDSWSDMNIGLTYLDVTSLAIDPVTPSTIYAGTTTGVFKSTNGGGSWSASLTSTAVWSLAIDPATPSTVYAGTSAGAFKSTDGGGSWSLMNSGLTGGIVQSLAIDPSTSETIYAGTDAGVFKSINGGSWSAMNSGLTSLDVTSLAIDPVTPSTIYASTWYGGVFRLNAANSPTAGTISLPKTGQATSYYPGDDGDLEKGISWPESRFTNPDGSTPVNGSIILDKLTGLEWPQDGGTPPFANCSGGTHYWRGALEEYVACLNANNYLNHNDWRLPNVNELASLVNRQQYNQADFLNSQGFINVSPIYYLTSSHYGSIYVWVVNMADGSIVSNVEDSESHKVWPVRTGTYGNSLISLPKTGNTTSYIPGDDGNLQKGADWPIPRFTNLDGTVPINGTILLDKLTSLEWPRDGSSPAFSSCTGGLIDWQSALNYVACLNANNYLNHNDWRLPNVNELASLVNRQHSNQSEYLNYSGFSNIQTSFYWTANTVADIISNAWRISMYDGSTSYYYYGSKADNHYVWPVRGGQSGSSTISFTPPMHDFGTTITYSASTTQEIIIGNSGTGNLIISKTNLSGTDASQFSLTLGTCSSLTPTLAPGEDCTVNVSFIPATVGTKTATLQIASNDPATPIASVALSGTAYDPPPYGTVSINGGITYTNNASVSLSLFAFDNSGIVSDMRFSNNNSSWSSWELYGTSKSWNLMTLGGDGVKTVFVQYRDGAGNIGSAFATITYDTTPPVTTITAKPASLYNAASGPFSFSSETGATFQCQVDGSGFSPCSTPYFFSGLGDGSHTFQVKATDPAGNMEITPASYTWTIDTTPPETMIDSQPTNPATSSPFAFSFSSTDGGAIFECRIDGGAYGACTSPHSIASLANGSHTFSVRAKDQAGNYDATPASYTWTVDIAGAVKIGSNNYATLTAALAAAPNGSTLKLASILTPETVNYTGNNTITIEGGYDATFSSRTGTTSVLSLTVTSGTVIIDGIVIQ